MIDDPSPFVVEWVTRLIARHPQNTPAGRPRALDVAMGRGRHALTLARAGARVFGVDWRVDALHDARRRAVAEGLAIHAWCADLRTTPLPRGAFDLIVVTRYLQRDLFVSICDALAPDGVLLYETFTVEQRRHGRGPTSAEHLLEPGELVNAFSRLHLIFTEETREPDALARLVARRS
jgi:SAM-dependent methyltransferase